MKSVVYGKGKNAGEKRFRFCFACRKVAALLGKEPGTCRDPVAVFCRVGTYVVSGPFLKLKMGPASEFSCSDIGVVYLKAFLASISPIRRFGSQVRFRDAARFAGYPTER